MTFTEAEFTKNTDWITRNLKKEIYLTGFDLNESQRVEIETDPLVEKAVETLPKARALLDSAKKIIVQRMAAQRETAR